MSNEITKSNGGILLSTYRSSDKASKISIINALNNSTSVNDEPEGKVYNCVGIIVESGVRKGRSGNADTACENTYIVCADGTSYFTQSDGIARSIKPIAELFFDKETGKVDPDFEDGFIPLEVKVNKLQNGNTIKTISIVM